MSEARSYGDVVAHSFHLKAKSHLITQTLKSSQVAISHLNIGERQFGLSPRIPAEDTFILAIYLTPVPDHELLSKGRTHIRQGYQQGAMRIVNLEGDFSARISSAHESLVFYIPRQALDDFTDSAELGRVSHLACEPGIVDPSLLHIARAMLPAFERSAEVNQLFIDYLVLAACAHLVHRYSLSRSHPIIMKGGLSPRQMARAEAFLAAHFSEDVSLGDVASHCGLSRAHFARAFKRTSGIAPHQWLLRYRVDRAKAMMLDGSATIAGIALACGFADQSHLTRVFTRMTGISPAAWRRENRSRLHPA